MESMTFVLFGATGDLAKRKIYPALYNLFLDNKISKPISVIGLGRKEISTHDFQAHVLRSIKEFSRRTVQEDSNLESFLAFFEYNQLNITNAEDYQALLKLVEKREAEFSIQGNRMFYLSVGPEFFEIISKHIQESGLGQTTGWRRLIIEKPFGRDLTSAQELNEKLSNAFAEEEIYRIDHYLGKPMVQNLESMIYANPVLESLWNNHHIANVQITASETVGVEGRAAYYDHSGAIRDMVQNHMLQLLMMVAMHQPRTNEAAEIRKEKKQVLNALRPVTKREAFQSIVRGQYSGGEVNGQNVEDYTKEPGVVASSNTDTFVAARLWIDDPFWKGVPFYIRTGKRMKEKSTRIVVEFRAPFKGLYEQGNPNLLIIEIAPNEGVTFRLNSKNIKETNSLEAIHVGYLAKQNDKPEAYELLIYDAMRGDSTFFAHWDEVEMSWKWIQPILEAFEENQLPLYHYPAGSYGPKKAEDLLETDGFTWWLDKETSDLLK